MKKLTSIICLLLIVALLPVFSSCQAPDDDGRITIVCTLFPQYDWVKNIVGNSDKIDVTLLIKNGSDPHSYQPSAKDVMEISSCDMIVYQGGEADLWVQEAIQRANAESTVKVALSEIEGMTLRDISASSHSHEEHDHDHSHETTDEHLWLSLSNAITATKALTEAICALDPDGEEIYKQNSAEYISRLTDLDNEYRSATESITDSFVLFADRFPFVYLLEDYGIDYSAAFEGCSADVDAGFDTVLSLIKEADAHGVKYIAVTESSDKSLATTVASSAGSDIEIIVMNSLQSVTSRQIDEGADYIGIMRENLSALKTLIGAE